MNDQDHTPIEQQLQRQLAGLRPRGAPAGLRQQVLDRMAKEETALTTPPEDCQARSRLDRMISLALAVSVVVAAGLWYVNLRVQPQRLASLLGPTPAERRAERLVQMTDLAADDPARQALQAMLRDQFQASNQAAGRRRPLRLHSAVDFPLEPLT